MNNDEKMWAMFCHISAVAGFIFPFGNIIAPLLIWQLKKNESSFIDDQGKEALNFQITMTILIFISMIFIIILIGIVMVFAVICLDLVFVVVAAIRSNNGEKFRYPFCMRFVR